MTDLGASDPRGGVPLDSVDLNVLKGSRAVALTVGAISLVIGIVAMAWPDHTVKAVAVVVGIGFLIAGIAQTLDALVTHRAGTYWGLLLIRGLLDLVVGLVAIFYPEITVAIVCILVGLNLVIGGIIQIVLSRRVPKGLEARSMYLWRGIFWIVFGVIVIAVEGMAAVVFTFVVGIFFVLSGVLLLVLGFRLGKAERELA
jgi:uncharacterized membrane protein HdeD (DUF308 family)